MHNMFKMLAGYNSWANARLYAACADLSDAERKASRKAFFGSIHRTLNHLLLCDRMWLSRIEPGRTPITDPLDTELYTDFAELRRERETQDEAIIAYVNAQNEQSLGEMKRYANASGQPQETRHGTILQHYFNHQTHHRGQVHCLLTGFGLDAPVLDLAAFQRISGLGMS